MPTLNFQFNTQEDEGLHFTGSVKFASDFDVGGRDSISFRGLGAWRDPLKKDTKTIYVSQNFLDTVLTPRRLSNFQDSEIQIRGLKARHDILLPAALREKGDQHFISVITKFFKTLSSGAKVTLESQASDEDTN